VEHLEECSGEASFVELPREAVAELIASDDLPCEEAVVVAAVRAWFDHNIAGRAGALKSLVPLIRWPLLPVAVQLGLWEEPLFLRMMESVQERSLGLRLMSECLPAFAKSDAAAACPRLKRRKGSMPPVLPLALTAFAQQSYTVGEDGALLTSTGSNPVWRPALCRERVMNSGKSCAEVTLVTAVDLMIGVGRPTLDANATGAWMSADFWGMHSGSGVLCHDSKDHSWQGRSLTTGDVLRLLLDSDAGTLTVKKNGNLLGVAVTEGLTGDLCWAVSSYSDGSSLRIKAADPAEF
jgi:hypothetical protein